MTESAPAIHSLALDFPHGETIHPQRQTRGYVLLAETEFDGWRGELASRDGASQWFRCACDAWNVNSNDGVPLR